MSGELRLPPEAAIAVHANEIKHLKSRDAENREWHEKHAREDDELHRDNDERYTKIGTDVSLAITALNSLNKTLEPIIKAYWGEDSSKVTHDITSSPPRRPLLSPELKQGGIIAGLMTVVLALLEVIKALVHPAPPPAPSPSEIAAEVAKAVVAASQKHAP